MNFNNFCMMDFETTGVNPETAQPVQLAAVMIDGRKLEIIPNSEFSVLIKPLYGEECATAGLSELTDGAIKIHKKDHALLAEQGISLQSAMENFVLYVNTYNLSRNQWKAPIISGYNIINYDVPILKRDLKRTGLDWPFHPFTKFDVMQLMFLFFENDKDVSSISADSLIRKHMGWKDEGQSHDALGDVKMTAEVAIKSMRLIRKSVSRINFKGCFE